MEVGSILYLKKNINVYAKIISEINFHHIPHYQISIYRGDSVTEACLSKNALEKFYQKSPTKKINFIKKIFNSIKSGIH